jgi:hypothetical protein
LQVYVSREEGEGRGGRERKKEGKAQRDSPPEKTRLQQKLVADRLEKRIGIAKTGEADCSRSIAPVNPEL